MSELTWQEPPPSNSGRGSGKWAAVANELRARPGEWALVAQDAHSTLATHIKRGRLTAFQPDGSFEAVTRRSDSGRDLYARFVGAEVTQ